MKKINLLLSWCVLMLINSSCDPSNGSSMEIDFEPDKAGTLRFGLEDRVLFESDIYAYRSEIDNPWSTIRNFRYVLSSVPCFFNEDTQILNCDGSPNENGVFIKIVFITDASNVPSVNDQDVPSIFSYQINDDNDRDILRGGRDFKLRCREDYLDPVITIVKANRSYLEGQIEGDLFRQLIDNISTHGKPFPCEAYAYEGAMKVEFSVPLTNRQ